MLRMGHKSWTTQSY